jgi:hypothetical protein
VPYSFAHPAAVIPLYRLLGKSAVPSALVIGSVIPDAWYFVPLLDRAASHSVAGLFLFCLPAGLFTYAAFHLVFKHPLLELLPRGIAGRVGAWTCPGLPGVPWRGVALSLLAGALTHLAWDALTHRGLIAGASSSLEAPLFSLARYPVHAHQLLQHASTLFGTLFLAWWVCRKLRRISPTQAELPLVPEPARKAIVALLLVLTAIAFLIAVLAVPPSTDIQTIRNTLRPAGVIALSTLGLLIVAYCVLWRFAPWR